MFNVKFLKSLNYTTELNGIKSVGFISNDPISMPLPSEDNKALMLLIAIKFYSKFHLKKMHVIVTAISPTVDRKERKKASGSLLAY